MSKSISSLIFVLVFAAWNDQPARSQSDQPDGDSAITAESTIDAVEAELRELICSQAADFSNRSQQRAIDLVERREYKDKRFDAPIRKILKESSTTDQWDAGKIKRALELLPFSTLDPKQLTELVFACYFKCDDSSEDVSLSRIFRKHLARYPDQTSKLIYETMAKDGVRPKLFPLLSIVGSSSEAMLPMLLDACKSDDRSLAEQSVDVTDYLIQRLKVYKQTQKLQKAIDGAPLDKKYIAYAEKIFGRYDIDKDKSLSADEWEKMLMSPIAADIDNDHLITVIEYAAWMQQRSQRKRD